MRLGYRSRLSRITIAIALVFGALHPVLQAENKLESLLPPKEALPRPKILVLKTGQVLEGEIRAQIGGYQVNSPAGSVIVQYEQVRVAAESPADAYRKIHDNRRDPLANDRIELAQWCLRVGLPDEAQEELLAALRLEPERIEARRMLLQVDALRRKGQTGAKPAGTGVDVTMRSPVHANRGAVAVGELSREHVADFSRQIQPLLLNCCGNAACHGGAPAGGFELRPTARRNRLETDANLADVLTYIDATQPEGSPLLSVPRRTDGVHDRAFHGPKAEEQYIRLAEWVRSVAAAGKAGVVVQSPATTAGTIVPASATIPVPNDARSVLTPPSTVVPPVVSDLPRSLMEVDDGFLRRIVEEERPDPFDPDEFNRRVHGVEVNRR